jgi:C1A family cysteine protease
MEAMWNIQNKNPDLDIDLSEQFVLDCGANSTGCSGTMATDLALSLAQSTGVPSEACDPYQAHDAVCVSQCTDSSQPKLWKVQGEHMKAVNGVMTPATTLAMQKWMRNHLTHIGPVMNTMYDEHHWSPTNLNCAPITMGEAHVVVIVGYDHANKYWIVKNSWGDSWNGNGYFKVSYGGCEIDDRVSYGITAIVAPN